MVVLPPATPVTVPAETEAILLFALAHVPPVGDGVSGVVLEIQTDDAPVSVGLAFINFVVVPTQPLADVPETV